MNKSNPVQEILNQCSYTNYRSEIQTQVNAFLLENTGFGLQRFVHPGPPQSYVLGLAGYIKVPSLKDMSQIYDVPVEIILPSKFPEVRPEVKIKPPQGTVVAKVSYLQGYMVVIPYIVNWHYPGCQMNTMAKYLISAFQHEFPLFKLKNPAFQQMPQMIRPPMPPQFRMQNPPYSQPLSYGQPMNYSNPMTNYSQPQIQAANINPPPQMQIPQPAKQPVDEPAEEGKECVICFTNAKSAALIPCGHLCCCYSCASTLQSKGKTCPICRGPINSILKTFLA